jgi:hypothetical protein
METFVSPFAIWLSEMVKKPRMKEIQVPGRSAVLHFLIGRYHRMVTFCAAKPRSRNLFPLVGPQPACRLLRMKIERDLGAKRSIQAMHCKP